MKPARALFRRRKRPAFTLVELLVVLAIVAVITAISIPAFLQVTQSTVLTTASNQVIDQLNFARQQALSLNQQVQVCLYKLPSPNNSAVSIYRGVQSFAINATATPPTTNALTRPVLLPPQVQIADPTTTTFSVLPVTAQTGPFINVSLPVVGTTYTYSSFTFRSDGSTTTSTPVCLTLFLVNNPPSGTTLPKNWFTMQIDPLTGRIETYRP